MSVGANDVANGCTVLSSRHAARSIPQRSSTASANRRCACRGKRPRRHESSIGSASWTARSHGYERCLQRVEDRHDLVRLHARLVVVEDDVVRIAVVLEARDVLPAQLEVALEVRQHDRVVLLLARAEPALVARASRPASSRRGAPEGRGSPSRSRGARCGSGLPRTTRSRAPPRTDEAPRAARRGRARR